MEDTMKTRSENDRPVEKKDIKTPGTVPVDDDNIKTPGTVPVEG